MLLLFSLEQFYWIPKIIKGDQIHQVMRPHRMNIQKDSCLDFTGLHICRSYIHVYDTITRFICHQFTKPEIRTNERFSSKKRRKKKSDLNFFRIKWTFSIHKTAEEVARLHGRRMSVQVRCVEKWNFWFEKKKMKIN